MNKYINNYNIIMLSNIPYDYTIQRHHHLAKNFSIDNTVYFINPGKTYLYFVTRIKKILPYLKKPVIQKITDKIFLVNPPVLLPLNNLSRTINKINQWLLWQKIKKYFNNKSKNIIWCMYPFSYELTNFIPHKLLIFDYTDYITFTNSLQKKNYFYYITKLIDSANIRFSVSKNVLTLAEPTKNKKFITFTNLLEPCTVNENLSLPDCLTSNKKSIGFIGSIDNRIDWKLVNYLSKEFQNINFIFLGPTFIDITNYKKDNVIFLDAVHYEDVFSYVQKFTFGFIPYKNTDYLKILAPDKLYIYFHLGKALVTSNIIRLKKYIPLLKTANNNHDFKNNIRYFLENDNKDFQIKRQKIADKNTYKKKLNTVYKLMYRKISRT